MEEQKRKREVAASREEGWDWSSVLEQSRQRDAAAAAAGTNPEQQAA